MFYRMEFHIFLLFFFILKNILAVNETYLEHTNSSESYGLYTNEVMNSTDETDLGYTDTPQSEETVTVNTTDSYNSTSSEETEIVTTEGIQTTSTESTSTTVEVPAEARPVSNEPCTCDLTVSNQN